MFWKILEICNTMGTRICKIIEEMSEIIEPKVGNPKNSVSRNLAILSHLWNLTFFEDEIFKHFSHLYGLKVPKWNFAHNILWISTKTNEKDLKVPNSQTPWLKKILYKYWSLLWTSSSSLCQLWLKLYVNAVNRIYSTLVLCNHCVGWVSRIIY